MWLTCHFTCTSQVLWCKYDISATFSILLEMSDVMYGGHIKCCLLLTCQMFATVTHQVFT